MAGVKPKPELVLCELCEGRGEVPMAESPGKVYDFGSGHQRMKAALSRVPTDCPDCKGLGWKIKARTADKPARMNWDDAVDAGGWSGI